MRSGLPHRIRVTAANYGHRLLQAQDGQDLN